MGSNSYYNQIMGEMQKKYTSTTSDGTDNSPYKESPMRKLGNRQSYNRGGYQQNSNVP